ncbi:uncharacterized protein FOMMEDRAFT_58981, partial [Fomitiporia mediterranea MF3/22]|uniref:uncharacterized protein n=1 Tax=Fomitiporia mediterranea (strain MF3/22) TaxID=694068 RepID=UPI00044073F5
TICDNQGSTSRARRILANAPYVLFDCEGHNSKCRDGSESLSLVQLGTPHAEEIFVFDMLALKDSNRATRSVLSLINSPKILKVGWGGVQDYTTLWRIYNTPMQAFLDLQIVDIQSRIHRREPRKVQISRLASDHFPSSVIEKLQIDGVHALSTMDKALVEHGINGAPRK